MTEEKEVKLQKQRYSKSAFVEAATDSKEKLILQVILEEKATYTKDDVVKKVKEWKSTKINAKEKKEGKA